MSGRMSCRMSIRVISKGRVASIVRGNGGGSSNRRMHTRVRNWVLFL